MIFIRSNLHPFWTWAKIILCNSDETCFLSDCLSLMLGISHSLYTAFSSKVGAWGLWACSLFLHYRQDSWLEGYPFYLQFLSWWSKFTCMFMWLFRDAINMYFSNCYPLAFTGLGNWNIKTYIIVFILYLSMCHCISVFNITSLLSEMFSIWTLHQYIINQSSFQIKSYSPNKFASLNIYFYK